MDTKETVKIKISELNFYYGNYQALTEINIDVYKNKALALIGPSGCGKSTLLRCINRIYNLYPKHHATGKILLDGTDILSPQQDLNVLRSKVGMVFQVPTPFPMSIFDNVAFGVRLYERLDKYEMAARVEWALKKAALWNEVKNVLKHGGLSLSGGQQQRLCIARAIAIKPEVLLLDEPASALDPISTGRIEALVHELKKDYTVIIVTHNMQQALRVSDYTSYVYMGSLIETDTTETIFHNAKNQITRDYVSGKYG